MSTHLSVTLVLLVSIWRGLPLESLGKKGKSGVLKSQETRRAFLEDTSHRIRFVYCASGKKQKERILYGAQFKICGPAKLESLEQFEILPDCQYTPHHSSWLNQIEIWFSGLVRRVLKRGNFVSVEDLTSKILKYIDLNFCKTHFEPKKHGTNAS